MDKSSIPDVLRPRTRTTMSNVDIFTSVLEPVNRTQNRVIFNLRQQGILNAGSRIVMTIHPDNATLLGTCFFTNWSWNCWFDTNGNTKSWNPSSRAN